MKKYNPSDIRIVTEKKSIEALLKNIEEEKIPYPLTSEIRSPKEQSRIIELLFLRIPLQQIMVFRNIKTKNIHYMENEDILEDLLEFTENRFKLNDLKYFPEFNNCFYNELPFSMKRRILEAYIDITLIDLSSDISDEEFKNFILNK